MSTDHFLTFVVILAAGRSWPTASALLILS